MVCTHIKNGNVITPNGLRKNSTVTIAGSRIISVGKTVAKNKDSFTVDAKGCFVSPGFIDCHIHGDPEDIFKREIKFGTTAVLIAESCAAPNILDRNIGRIKEFIQNDALGKNVLGVYLEGPYLNKEKAGAQDKRFIKKPDKKELLAMLARYRPLLKIMTIAPEIKGSRALIQLLRRRKVIAALGHSDATYREAMRGIASGIRHATHLFNAMRPIGKNDPGASGAALLNDAVSTEVILDRKHVRKPLFDLVLKLKSHDKIVLVTDSVAACPPKNARILDGAYRRNDGHIAGSLLTIIGALKNAMSAGGISVEEALRFVTKNPARLLGVDKQKGSIAPGKDADIVIFDKEFNVKMTIIRGKIMYRKKGF